MYADTNNTRMYACSIILWQYKCAPAQYHINNNDFVYL